MTPLVTSLELGLQIMSGNEDMKMSIFFPKVDHSCINWSFDLRENSILNVILKINIGYRRS